MSVDADAGARTESGGVLARAGLAGAVAGLAGGLVFGAAMAVVGTLPSVAQIVRSDAAGLGFAVNMLIAAAIGAGFGLLVAHQQVRGSETLFWGLLYGAFWWFLGPQTLLPILTGRPVDWDLAGARELFPSLVGHLFYGGVTALVFVALRRRGVQRRRPRIGPLLRGVSAGVVTAVALYVGFDVMAGAELGTLAVLGVLAGAGYPLLFGGRREAPGPALVRGAVYGFLIWVLAALTVTPLLRDGTLGWSRDSAVAAVAQLPPSVLLGAGIAVVFGLLGALGRGLFVDDIRMRPREAPGGRGLRALGHGAVAGLAGGAVFTVVLVAVGGLPQIAQIMGSQAPTAGVVIHLVIAQLIGVTYAVLFRRSSFDLASGIGWGVSYGFFWWVLGGLTLLPALTGAVPQWDAAGITAAFPSLVGHLGYGAALGAVHYRLVSRADPWWINRGDAEAERVSARRSQALGSAPALWGLTVLIALIVPLLVLG